MERKPAIDVFGASVLISFSVLLGLNQALVKLVNAGFAPVFQSGLRSACAFLPVLAYAVLMRRRLSLSDGTFGPGIVNGLLFSGEFCLVFLALDFTSVARVSLFFYTMPFWVAIGAHFIIPGERLSKRRFLGLAIAIAGVTLALLDDSHEEVNSQAWIGDLLALGGAVFWASIALLTRTSKLSSATPEMNLLYQLGVSAIVLLTISPLFAEPIRELTPLIVGIFTFQVFVVVAFGFVVWFWILTVYPVSDMASFGLLAPVFGVFFGWLIFDDELTISFIAALAIVGSGIFLINSRRRT